MRTYPRTTLKRAIKAHVPKKPLGKDVDLLVRWGGRGMNKEKGLTNLEQMRIGIPEHLDFPTCPLARILHHGNQ